MMTTRLLRLVPVVALLLLAALSPAREDAPKPPPRAQRLSEAEIERYVGLLGSSDFRERERASEMLKWRPEAAIALLRASRNDPSPEVRRRAELLLSQTMSPEDAKKRLARLPEYVKHRQVDRLVETMVFCREFLTTEHDVHVRALVKDLCTAAIRGKDPRPGAKHQSDFKTFAWASNARRVVASVAEPLGHPDGGNGIIASDQIKGNKSFRHCIAICNGDVDVSDCHIYDSILIATGNVRVTGVYGGTVLCSGHVEITMGGGCIVAASAGRITAFGDYSLTGDTAEFSIIRERDTEFFRTWNLYSATEVGARLWSLFGVVGVSAVTPNSAFAKAGIRPGDILKQINGTPVRSVRDANRLLCRATVSWGAADLAIVCNRQKSELTLSLFHW